MNPLKYVKTDGFGGEATREAGDWLKRATEAKTQTELMSVFVELVELARGSGLLER